MKSTKIIMACIGIFVAVGAAYGGVLFQEDFNSYAVAGKFINGSNGWTATGVTANQTNSIGGVSSYFNGGGKSLYLYDNDTTAALGNQLLSVSPAAISNAGPMVFSFDFNVRTNGENPTFTVYQNTTAALALNFMNVSYKMRYNPAGTLIDVSPYVLSTSYWYHAEITVGDLSTSSDTFDLKVWEAQTNNDSGTVVIDVTGLGFRNNVSYVDKLTFGTAGANGQSGSKYNLDNILVQSIPEPATLGMLGLGAGGLMLIRRWLACR